MKDLAASLAEINEQFTGTLHVSAAGLTEPGVAEFDSATPVATASVIKVPILLAALKHAELGHIDLEEQITPSPRHAVQGSGVLRLLSPDLQMRVLDLLVLMIATSDNIATNAVLDLIDGGVAEVNRTMDALGLNRIRLRNRIDLALIADDPELLGVAPMQEVHRLMRAIHEGDAISGWVSAQAERVLGSQLYLDQVTKYFQVNPYAAELDAVAPLTVASKTGFVPGTRVDAGIVQWQGGGFTYACAAVNSVDVSFAADAEPSLALGDVGLALMKAFWNRPGEPPIVDKALKARPARPA